MFCHYRKLIVQGDNIFLGQYINNFTHLLCYSPYLLNTSPGKKSRFNVHISNYHTVFLGLHTFILLQSSVFGFFRVVNKLVLFALQYRHNYVIHNSLHVISSLARISRASILRGNSKPSAVPGL